MNVYEKPQKSFIHNGISIKTKQTEITWKEIAEKYWPQIINQFEKMRENNLIVDSTHTLDISTLIITSGENNYIILDYPVENKTDMPVDHYAKELERYIEYLEQQNKELNKELNESVQLQ